MAFPGTKISVILCIRLICAMALTASAQTWNEGDLVFVIPHDANAITAVTESRGGEKLNSQLSTLNTPDHVAIAHYIGGVVPYVIEAAPDHGVCLTPVDSFQIRHNDDALRAARVTADVDVRRSVANALRHVGKPYDDIFADNDTAFYCSELIQKSFVNHSGQRIFDPIPMSFRDTQGNIPDFWRNHYRQRNLPIPEGEPGSNPAALLQHPAVSLY